MDPILVVTLATLAFGFGGLVLKYVFRSKCEHVSLMWGCCSVVRNVVIEEECEKIELDHGINLSADLPQVSGLTPQANSK